MAWAGYFALDGTEIINVSRTETYALNAGLAGFRAVYKNDALALLLGQEYRSPFQDDDTPWADLDRLESYDFYGAYPLNVVGVEGSTVSADVVESTLDGGNVGRPRRTTRAVVFSAALLGGSDCAVDYGLRWLRIVLNNGGCRSQNGCGGGDLEFLSCEPAVDLTFSSSTVTTERLVVDGGTAATPGPEPVSGGTPTASGSTTIDGGNPSSTQFSTTTEGPIFDFTVCLPEYLRFLNRVTVVSGPTVVQKNTTSRGQAVWIVEWTAVAADPAEYSAERPVIAGFMDSEVLDPYVDGAPSGGLWDADGYVTTDPDCPTGVYVPVFDPTCPLLIPPPPVPSIPVSCFDFPLNYIRRAITIPAQFVPTWNDVVPVITLHTPGVDVRGLRVRFFTDVDAGLIPDDPCDDDGSVLFTYLPAGATVIFDGVNRVIYVDTPAFGRRRADAIATGPDGGPLQWPALACGDGFVVTVDMPQTQEPPSLDLSLYGRVT